MKIYNLSCEYAKKVREKSNSLLKELGTELPPPIPMQSTRKVWCYPVQFAIACPRLPVVEYLPERDQALLRFQGDTLAINTNYLQKLVSCSILKFKYAAITDYQQKIILSPDVNLVTYYSVLAGRGTATLCL